MASPNLSIFGFNLTVKQDITKWSHLGHKGVSSWWDLSTHWSPAIHGCDWLLWSSGKQLAECFYRTNMKWHLKHYTMATGGGGGGCAYLLDIFTLPIHTLQLAISVVQPDRYETLLEEVRIKPRARRCQEEWPIHRNVFQEPGEVKNKWHVRRDSGTGCRHWGRGVCT